MPTDEVLKIAERIAAAQNMLTEETKLVESLLKELLPKLTPSDADLEQATGSGGAQLLGVRLGVRAGLLIGKLMVEFASAPEPILGTCRGVTKLTLTEALRTKAQTSTNNATDKLLSELMQSLSKNSAFPRA